MSSSIPHIEDLGPIKLWHVIENLHKFRATEKIDGSQLLFGIDECGFYTSRETKGGNRIYSADQYSNDFSTTYRKFAHTFLESQLDTLRAAGLSCGDQIEIEVLYGTVPNVVPYSTEINRVVLLRSTAGSVHLSALAESLAGKTYEVSHRVPITTDGRNTEMVNLHTRWCLCTVPGVDVIETDLNKLRLDFLNKLRDEMHADSGIHGMSNIDAYLVPLNRKPGWCQDWSSLKVQLKEHRLVFDKFLDSYKTLLKRELISMFVVGRHSRFGELGGWIEGVVLSYKDVTVKVVDKKTFSVAREFIWKERHSLMGRHPDNFYIALRSRILELVNTEREHKRMLESLRCTLDSAEQELAHRLDKYKKLRDSYSCDIAGVGIIVYNENINNRTLEVYSSLFNKLCSISDILATANDRDSLIKELSIIGI